MEVQEKNSYLFDEIYQTAKQYGYRFIEFWKGTKNQEKHFMHIYEDICNTSDCEVEIERKIVYLWKGTDKEQQKKHLEMILKENPAITFRIFRVTDKDIQKDYFEKNKTRLDERTVAELYCGLDEKNKKVYLHEFWKFFYKYLNKDENFILKLWNTMEKDFKRENFMKVYDIIKKAKIDKIAFLKETSFDDSYYEIAKFILRENEKDMNEYTEAVKCMLSVKGITDEALYIKRESLDDQIEVWKALDGFFEKKENWFEKNIEKYEGDIKALIKIWGSIRGDFIQYDYKGVLKNLVSNEMLSKEDAIKLFSNTEPDLLSLGTVLKLIKKIDMQNASKMFDRYCNLKELHPEINQTLNLGILEEKVATFIGEDKLVNLACNELLQDQIQNNINNKNFMKVLGYIARNRENWALEMDTICKNFAQYEKLINNIKSVDLQDEQLKQLYFCLLQRKNWFKVETLDELENYEKNRKEICQNILEGKDTEGRLSKEFEDLTEKKKRIFAILELSYGMDIESARNLVYKYGKDIDEILKGKYANEKVTKELKNLKTILNLTKEEAKTLYDKNKKTIQEWKNIEYSASVHIEEQALQLFEKLYNDEIKLEENLLESIKYNGKNVKVSEITGDFKAFFRVEGAYNANWREPENFNDSFEKIEPVWKRQLQKFCV